MKMPTTTNIKVEAKPSTDEGNAAKQCLNCLEKKVRNLEKRKGRIEQNQEKARKGTKLEKEQENSLQQYEQVTHDLEFARELQKQFLQINGEHEKMAKKQAKREKAERQALEIKRISEILQLQSLLDLLGGDKVREDFKTGKHGAVVLTDDNLNHLDELYQAISPSRDDSGEEYPQRLNTAAEHLVNFLDGKDRQVVGTTYKELKELITLINGCGYFERARKAETEDNVSESNQETEEFVDTTEEPVNDSETETANGQEVTETPQQQQPQQQQPIDLTMGTSGATQPQRDLPTQPLNTLEQDVFFAPSSTPYEADAETQFSQPSHTAASRMPDFQSFTNNRPFQFIQTSYVMPESAPGVVDPAVIAAQPAGSSGLTFISQGFDATAAQAPTAAQQQAPQPQQQQQQQPQSQPQQPSAPQQSNQPVSSVGVGDLSSNAGGLQQQPQQTTSQPPQSQQQQQQQTQDFSSQSYAQAGLQQNLQTEGLFSAQPVAVTEVSNSLPSHSGIMAQMRDENVTASPYEIPPSIPMPPSQSQDQSQRDQQQQQQEKKFQMNASAPVFQSMYAQQVAAGQAGPVNVPPPSVTDTQAPPPPTDFTNAPTPGGDFGQPNTDFPQTYQSNNGFASGGYQRGGRGGGFRGSRGGGGNGGNRNSGAGGNPMQNGFSGRGGAANTNSNRGGRGGTYQGYPPNNNYRPESFQGSYNAGGFGGGFQKRGGMNAGGPGGATYPRGSAGGNAGRGGTGGGGMRGGMPRGGGTGPRGAPRGGFNRPMPTQ